MWLLGVLNKGAKLGFSQPVADAKLFHLAPVPVIFIVLINISLGINVWAIRHRFILRRAGFTVIFAIAPFFAAELLKTFILIFTSKVIDVLTLHSDQRHF